MDKMNLSVLILLVTTVTTEVKCFEAPSNSCAVALHNYLKNQKPLFDVTQKSLSIEIGKYDKKTLMHVEHRCRVEKS